MDTRQRILNAALEVYGQRGFRGATTRRIAALAGVNEVTVFRHFGSKQTLLAEALRAPSAGSESLLPEAPASPGSELRAWTEIQMRSLTARSRILRASIGDMEERPELVNGVVAWQTASFAELSGYLDRLRELGFVRSRVHLRTAAMMLTAAIFSDATRAHPELEKLTVEERAESYITFVLSALGVAAGGGTGHVVRAPVPPTMPDATGA